jgi:hypothetical protein
MISGGSLLFYQFTRRVMKLTEEIMGDITAINFIQNLIEYSILKADLRVL